MYIFQCKEGVSATVNKCKGTSNSTIVSFKYK